MTNPPGAAGGVRYDPAGDVAHPDWNSRWLPNHAGWPRRCYISELLERLRASGWRVTPQRRAVAEVLTGQHVHLTAEDVHERARERVPEISLATVYNTLRQLAAMGEVLEVTVADGPRRYDPNVGVPHQHLVCVSCGDLRDVHPDGELTLARAERHGFTLRGVEVCFQGVCPRCRAAAG